MGTWIGQVWIVPPLLSSVVGTGLATRREGEKIQLREVKQPSQITQHALNLHACTCACACVSKSVWGEGGDTVFGGGDSLGFCGRKSKFLFFWHLGPPSSGPCKALSLLTSPSDRTPQHVQPPKTCPSCSADRSGTLPLSKPLLPCLLLLGQSSGQLLMKCVDSGMSWKAYKSPEAQNPPDTDSSPSPRPCLLLLIWGKSVPTPTRQVGPRAHLPSGLLLWAFSGRSKGFSRPSRDSRGCPYKTHPCRRAHHIHSTPAVSFKYGWCPSPTQVFPLEKEPREPQGRDLREMKRHPISLPLQAVPQACRSLRGPPLEQRKNSPGWTCPRPAPTPGASTRAHHTQASPRTHES